MSTTAAAAAAAGGGGGGVNVKGCGAALIGDAAHCFPPDLGEDVRRVSSVVQWLCCYELEHWLQVFETQGYSSHSHKTTTAAQRHSHPSLIAPGPDDTATTTPQVKA
jgi:hypothetical protein